MASKQKRRRLIPALAVFAVIAAACGGGGGGGGGGEKSLSGQKVEVAAVWSGTEEANFKQVLDRFSSDTGATVTFTSTGDDIATVLGTRLEGGNPPDVAILPQPGLLADLAGQGALQPIDNVVGSEMSANFAPVWSDLGSVDGTLYGVYFKAANKSTVWYNMNVFNGAGVQPPQTWDEMMSDAKTISDFGVTPYSIGGADGWTLTDWFENIYLRTAGADKYDQLTKHEIKWTDPSVKQALSVFAQVVDDPSLIAGGTSGALGTDFPTSVHNVFADPENPKAAIVYEGDFVGSVIIGDTPSKLGTDANFFNFPSIDGSAPAVVGGGDVAVLMKNSEAGKALIKFLATPDAGEIWAHLGGFTSPNKNVDPSVYPDDITRASAEALTSAEAFRFDMSDLEPAAFGGTPGAGEWKILQDFVSNPSDVAGTQKALESAAAKAFSSS